MAWLVLGEENVVRIQVADVFRMKLNEITRCIDEERVKGNFVLACVAYARSMRVDNLDSIADRLREKDVWFHVDAYHGNQIAFSHKHRHEMKGRKSRSDYD